MGLSLASIEHLLSTEYPQATQEVKDFVAWVRGRDAQVTQDAADFRAAIDKQQATAARLASAGYTVVAGTLSPPTSAS